MTTGILEYENGMYLFKLAEDSLNISSIECLPGNENFFESLNEFKKVFKTNLENNNFNSVDDYDFGLYVYGITYDNEFIIFNIAYEKKSNLFKHKIEFKINFYYKVEDYISYEKNKNNDYIVMTVEGNDIKNFHNKYNSFDFTTDELINLPSIANYEYVYNNNTFKIDVDIDKTKTDINKIEGYNRLNFRINSENTEYTENIPELIFNIYHGCLNFFRFICRKKYLDINNRLKVRYLYQNIIYKGTFVFCRDEFKEEITTEYEDKIINYNFIKNTNFISELFKLCIDEQILLNYLPDSVSKRFEYTPSRILEIFSVFENEYRYYAEVKNNNKEKNNEKKQEVIEKIKVFLNELIKKYNGKEGSKKRYVETFLNKVEELKDLKTLKDKFYELFKKNTYILNLNIDNEEIDEKYNEEIDNICKRLVSIRNDFSHGRIGITEFDINDLNYVEKTIYVMRLKILDLSDDKIKLILKALF